MRDPKKRVPAATDVDRWIVDELVWLLKRFDVARTRRLLTEAASKLGWNLEQLLGADNERRS